MKLIAYLSCNIFLLVLLALTLNGQVSFNISAASNIVAPTDPIEIDFIIRNEGRDTISVNRPSIYKKTVQFIVTHEKKDFGKYVEWYGPPEVNKIIIPPSGDFTYEFDMTEIYPFLFDPGEYEITARYYPDSGEKKSATESTNSILLTIKALSPAELIEKAAYMELVYVGDFEADVTSGHQFLEKYPNSIFSNRVKRRIASSLKVLKRYDEAIMLINSALESGKLSKREKGEFISDLSWTYYWKGDLEKAIKTLRDQEEDTTVKRFLLRKWEKELGNRKD